MLLTFRCLPCRVWHPPKLGKARPHSPSPLSQSINNRPSPFNFHHSSSFLCLFRLGFLSAPRSGPTTLRSDLNPHLGEASPLRWSILLAQFPRRPSGPRLVSCVPAHGLPRLKARTFPLDFLDRCPSRPSPAPSRVILDLPVSLSPSLSVLLFSAHSWPPVPRSISVAIIVHGVLGNRHRHDKGASKAEPAQSYRLCAETNWTNASHHPERVSYCAAGEWIAWCCCQRSGDIFCRSLACGNWAASSSSARLGFRHQLVLTWQRLDWEDMHVHCAALPGSGLGLLERWHFPVPSCAILPNTLHPCHLHRKYPSSWRRLSQSCRCQAIDYWWIIDD